VFNRGVAGLSIGPLYLGEIGLIIGLPFLLKALFNTRKRIFWINILILTYFFWGLVHLNFRRIDIYSLQQFSLIYYTLFIPIGYEMGKRYNDIFERVFPIFLKIHVIFALLRPIVISSLIDTIKIGDTSLFGIYGTYVLFTVPAVFYFIFFKKNIFWALLSLIAVISLASRNGFLALIICSLILIIVARFKESSRYLKICLITVSIFALFGTALNNITGLQIRGDLSLTNIMNIAESIVVESDDSSLEGSRSHRIYMWEKIINNRIDNGLTFGEGFGTNMTDAVFIHPHNSLVSIFGRTGLIGLLLWLLFYLKILFHNIRTHKNSLYKNRAIWYILFTISSLVTACFSVVLESPMLAIPIYLIYGISLSQNPVIRQHRN